MTTICAPAKRRSNRTVTNQVIKAAFQYLDGTDRRSWLLGDTVATVDDDSNFTVNLYENPILKIISCDHKPVQVCIYSGNYYDKYGNPTNTTRERLNGLLDALGSRGIVPQNVRVFYDQDYSICYVIRHESKVALNKDYCTMVGIKADPNELIFNDLSLVRPSDQAN